MDTDPITCDQPASAALAVALEPADGRWLLTPLCSQHALATAMQRQVDIEGAMQDADEYGDVAAGEPEEPL